jgi:protein-serine/threonine kinase
MLVRELSKRYSTNDFEVVGTIGSGAFGIVSLVRCKRTGRELAMKQIRKDGMLKKNHRDRLLAERALLSDVNTKWVVTLFHTFQDLKNLYMVMEYLPGGDLMSHLIRLDAFTESQTRFYMSQLVEAVHAVHSLGFIHRDIKPDNIVLTREGHVKLIDCGLCKFDPSIKLEALACDERVLRTNNGEHQVHIGRKLTHWTRTQLRSSVGTPQYMAPEVLTKSYDHTSDFWSVGVIAYECLMGGTPFYDESADTRPGKKPDVKRILHKVMNYREYLPIPFPGKIISPEAASFLRGLLCEASVRMRYDQIRMNVFFKGIDWNRLDEMAAPILPSIHGSPKPPVTGKAEPLPLYEPLGINKDRNLDFVGYTFNRFTVI